MTCNSIQKGFDSLTTVTPEQEQGHSWLTNKAQEFGAGAIQGAGQPFIHPIQTAKSVVNMVQHPIDSIHADVNNLEDHPAQFLCNLAGGTAVGGALGEAAGSVGGALRKAAIGDPDSAALKALNVPPKSNRVQSTLDAVSRTRPYVAGARNLEDLQSRIGPAKSEIWDPYQQAVGVIGKRQVQGPSGTTDVAGLEGERLQTSALNRELKSRMPNPEAVKLAEQKGMGQAQLLQHERDIKSALDPELSSTGIKPGATRATYGGVAKVGERVSGRSTVGEPDQPYGFGKLRNLDITKPLQAIPTVFDAGRDIVAGRPLFSGKPTDVAVRDAFRYGGPKPDLGRLTAPNLAAARPLGLNAPATQLGAPPSNYQPPQPPPFYHDTDAMRTGRLLNAPPIQLGGAVEGTRSPNFYHDTAPMRTGRLLNEPEAPPIQLGGQTEGPKGHAIPLRHYSDAQGQYSAGAEPRHAALVAHTDIFPNQRPGSLLRRGKTIEGKR